MGSLYFLLNRNTLMNRGENHPGRPGQHFQQVWFIDRSFGKQLLGKSEQPRSNTRERSYLFLIDGITFVGCKVVTI